MMTKKWNTQHIPSQKGKTILITGANSGLGLGTAKVLAKKEAHVILAARNLKKGQAAINEILKETPNASLDLMQLDLSDINTIKQFAIELKAKYSQLHTLINNAGVMMPQERLETKQGFEGQFGTNHLGHFVLTRELIDLLDNTPGARIVTLSSLVAKMGDADIYWDNLQFERDYHKMKSYSQSKLANMMFGLELDKMLRENGSKTISVLAHPGYTATNLQQHMGLQGMILNFFLAQKVEMGILPSLRAATDPSVKGGEYYGPANMRNWRGYPVVNKPSKKALDLNERRKLWEISEQLTNSSFQLS
ncbi:oxidoreductase [Flammeovirga sp. SubArs3]|uniref:oxidoreductase n=1 Tax=Flammeovirga sp. SubArs3 TaxID=2995316 RepID=UPI00248AFD59|nr:oxidoreductase [Flammeovirga sp. SubArs3]